MLLKVKDIRRDTEKFQFRSVEFNEDRVKWLVANWDASAVDPLDVWRTDEGDFLLSGHHRLEAMCRLKVEDCECRVHEFTLEEAQTFALKSNANRLQYSDYEYCRCVVFLVDNQKNTFSAAANELTLSPGMAKKYYSLKFLLGTDWETYNDQFDLTSRAFEVGNFCDVELKAGRPGLAYQELQVLFKLITENDFNASQTRQLLRDLKRQREKGQAETGSLFDLNQFGSDAVKAVRERNFLDLCAAQTWWLFELIQKEKNHQFPPEVQEPFEKQLRAFFAYCVGSDDPNITPTRAGSKGRSLRVNSKIDKAS